MEREKSLRPHQRYREYLESIGDQESVAEDAESLRRLETQLDEAELPKWWISLRRIEGLETVTGIAADIVPSLGMPRPNDIFSVRIEGGGSSIHLRFNATEGASIDVRSDDAAWLLNADLWVERQLREISPRYAWLGKPSLPYFVVAAGGLIGIVTAFLMVVNHAATPLAYPIAMLVLLVGAGAGVAVRSIPGTVMSPSPGAKGRAFGRELLWVIIGALAGQAVSVAWTAITAPPVP